MMQEEVIVTSIYISRIGERKHFQIALPTDTKKIIGLEYGAIELAGALIPVVPVTINPFAVKADKLMGRLSLQVPGREGVFYRGDLIEDRNYHLGEDVSATSWVPQLWSHSGRRQEIELAVNGGLSFVEGYFIDRYGLGEYDSLEYQLQLCLWIEKCIA